MKVLRIFPLLTVFFFFLFTSCAFAGDSNTGGVDPAQVRQLQEQMLSNPEIMALIFALQNDPDMQELLSDQKIIEAIQKGDTAAIASDPRFLKLANNPRVQAIVKQQMRHLPAD